MKATARRKKVVNHTIFLDVIKVLQSDECSIANKDAVLKVVTSWYNNAFPREVKLTGGIINVKEKTISSYNIGIIEKISDKVDTIVHIINEHVLKNAINISRASGDTRHSSVHDITIDSLRDKAIIRELIRQYVESMKSIPEHRKAEYRDTIHTGILIKCINTKSDIQIVDGAITSIAGIAFDEHTGKIVLTNLSKANTASSTRTSTSEDA